MPHRFLSQLPGFVSLIAVTEAGYFYLDVRVWGDEGESASTLYVEAADIPALKDALGVALNCGIQTDKELIDTLAQQFDGALKIENWIRESGLPYSYRYDDGAMLDAENRPESVPHGSLRRFKNGREIP